MVAAVREAPRTKQDFYRRWQDGEFGNRPRNWLSLDELEAADFSGTIGMRYLIPGSSFLKYELTVPEVRPAVESAVAQGARADWFSFTEHMPDHAMTIQGEVERTPKHLALYYSTVPGLRMRDGLRLHGRNVSGATARAVLNQKVDPAGIEWIDTLLDRYPGCVVEFSSYRFPVGEFQERTIIWEVRAY